MRLALVGVAVAAGVAAVVLAAVLARPEADRELAPTGRPITITATVTPQEHHVGDRVVARVTVAVDRALADPDLVDVRARFAPYRRVRPIELSREDAGAVTLIRYVFTLQCIERGCVTREPVSSVTLPQGIVDYTPRGSGFKVEDRFAWPELSLASRIAGGGEPELRAATESPPAASVRLSPELLGSLLAGAAALLMVAAGAAAAVHLRRVRPERPEVAVAAEVSPLEHALELVERAGRGGGEEERRTALDGLARALEGDGAAAGLAPRTRRLAWSAPPPRREEMGELTAGVRHAMENGA